MTNDAVKKCYDAGLSLLFHANGDAAIDSLLTAHEFAAAGSLDKDRRTTHVRNRGKAQAYFLSPMKTAYAVGLRPANHTDYSVAPIDHMMTIWTAVNRVSRSGEVIGPDERVTPLLALKGITINGAYIYREEASKGSLEPGSRARQRPVSVLVVRRS